MTNTFKPGDRIFYKQYGAWWAGVVTFVPERGHWVLVADDGIAYLHNKIRLSRVLPRGNG